MVRRLRATPSCRNGYQNLGRVGKNNLKKILQQLVWGFLAISVIACHSELSEHLQSGQVLALNGLQGRWVGPVAPTTPSCGPTTQGLMSIGKNGFGFDPFQSTAIIKGDISEGGHLSGRLVRQGGDRQDVSIQFDGAASGSDAINGTLQSGRCRWAVSLHRG